jgi:hypothetical protein
MTNNQFNNNNQDSVLNRGYKLSSEVGDFHSSNESNQNNEDYPRAQQILDQKVQDIIDDLINCDNQINKSNHFLSSDEVDNRLLAFQLASDANKDRLLCIISSPFPFSQEQIENANALVKKAMREQRIKKDLAKLDAELQEHKKQKIQIVKDRVQSQDELVAWAKLNGKTTRELPGKTFEEKTALMKAEIHKQVLIIKKRLAMKERIVIIEQEDAKQFKIAEEKKKIDEANKRKWASGEHTDKGRVVGRFNSKGSQQCRKDTAQRGSIQQLAVSKALKKEKQKQSKKNVVVFVEPEQKKKSYDVYAEFAEQFDSDDEEEEYVAPVVPVVSVPVVSVPVVSVPVVSVPVVSVPVVSVPVVSVPVVSVPVVPVVVAPVPKQVPVVVAPVPKQVPVVVAPVPKQVPVVVAPVVAPITQPSSNVKSTMCKTILEGKQCKFGKDCRFAHDKSEIFFMRMCKFVLENKKCPFGERCNYAHKKEELRVGNCRYGKDCKLVRWVSKCMNGGDMYENVSRCGFLHPQETMESYFARTVQGNEKVEVKKTQPTITVLDFVPLPSKNVPVNTKPEVKPEVKPVAKTNPWGKSEAKPEVKPVAKPYAKPYAKPVPEPVAKTKNMWDLLDEDDE